MADIVLDGVVKRYPDGFEAVKDLNLEIADGEFMILVGPSGCGKSTALNMIAGLEDISAGELRIEGKSSIRWRRATGTSQWCSRATRCTPT
jgi:multiple sugar transport system ATP-binding protein